MWTTDKVMELIEIFHGAPALWDVRCTEYRDKNKKFEELTRISEHFDTNVVEVIKKIKSLKTQFRREHKKILKCRSGDDVQSPEKVWFGYNLLKFLVENNQFKGSNNTTQAEVDEPDVYSISSREDIDFESEDIPPENSPVGHDTLTPPTSCNEPGPSSVSLSSRRHKRKKSADGQIEAYKLMRSVLQNIHQRDDFSIYGENLASRMRNASHDPRAIAIARNRIDDILFSLEMDEFRDFRCPTSFEGPGMGDFRCFLQSPVPVKEPEMSHFPDLRSRVPPKEPKTVNKHDVESPQSPPAKEFDYTESPQSPDSECTAAFTIHNRY